MSILHPFFALHQQINLTACGFPASGSSEQVTRIDREPIVGVSDLGKWQNVALVQQPRNPVFAAGLAALSQALAPVFP